MALRIVAASEPMKVDTVVVTIYAPPGIGKTSLGYSADAPLLIDTDSGAYRSAFRKDTAEAKVWADIAGISAADVKPYKTLVLDTAGRALDLLAADIMAGNPKLGRGGALTLQGYGELKSRFVAYLKLVRSFGLDVVLIAHSDEKVQGDELIERIDMQGGSKQEVYKVSDAMARLSVKGGKRVLSFSPTETAFGKDPVAIGSVEVPHLATTPDFLGSVIRQIKDGLNSLTAEQKQAVEKLDGWRDAVSEADDVDTFNRLRKEAKTRAEKEVLHAAATAFGLTYDKRAGEYVQPEAAVA